MLSYVLEREGYDVVLAEGGGAAVKILNAQGIDLLISDIRMPDMSGVAVLEAAKRIDPDIAGIMITAYASTATAVEALRSGPATTSASRSTSTSSSSSSAAHSSDGNSARRTSG